MQSITVTTHILGQPPETFTLDRAHAFAPWCLLGQQWVLYPIRPGQTYTHGTRSITCSPAF